MASIVERPRKDGTVAFQVKWREGTRQRSLIAVDRADARRIKRLVDAHGTYSEAMTRPNVPTVHELPEVLSTARLRPRPLTAHGRETVGGFVVYCLLDASLAAEW